MLLAFLHHGNHMMMITTLDYHCIGIITLSYPTSYIIHHTNTLTTSTHNIDEIQGNITNAYIVQHGNLRNAIDYFCGAVDAINSDNSIDISMQTLIIAPIFLIDGDKCWGTDMNQYTVSVKDGISCGYPVWSSKGWKEGHMALSCNTTASISSPMNSNEAINTARCKRAPTLHSYDVYNLLIKRLGDPAYFPNLKTVTLFGFSAGGYHTKSILFFLL